MCNLKTGKPLHFAAVQMVIGALSALERVWIRNPWNTLIFVRFALYLPHLPLKDGSDAHSTVSLSKLVLLNKFKNPILREALCNLVVFHSALYFRFSPQPSWNYPSMHLLPPLAIITLVWQLIVLVKQGPETSTLEPKLILPHKGCVSLQFMVERVTNTVCWLIFYCCSWHNTQIQPLELR